MSFYVSTATFFLLHCDEWDRVVALPRHKFVTGATLLQLIAPVYVGIFANSSIEIYADMHASSPSDIGGLTRFG